MFGAVPLGDHSPVTCGILAGALARGGIWKPKARPFPQPPGFCCEPPSTRGQPWPTVALPRPYGRGQLHRELKLKQPCVLHLVVAVFPYSSQKQICTEYVETVLAES